MKPTYFRIILTVLAFSCVFKNRVQAAVESLGDKASITIPNNWIVTSQTATQLYVQSPSGYVNIYIALQPRSTYGEIRFNSYENLNIIAKQLLMSYELDSICGWTNAGYPLASISSDPVFSGGVTSGLDFYSARLTREISYSDEVSTYGYLSTHQLMDDGKNLYQINTYIQSGTNNSEAIDTVNILSSISSSNVINPNGDSDVDGVSNFDEIILYGTDPNAAPVPQTPLLQGPTITSNLEDISISRDVQFPSYVITTNFGANIYSAKGLPSGLKLNAATGTITGYPTKVGVFTVTITASKKIGNVVSSAVTVTKRITVR